MIDVCGGGKAILLGKEERGNTALGRLYYKKKNNYSSIKMMFRNYTIIFFCVFDYNFWTNNYFLLFFFFFRLFVFTFNNFNIYVYLFYSLFFFFFFSVYAKAKSTAILFTRKIHFTSISFCFDLVYCFFLLLLCTPSSPLLVTRELPLLYFSFRFYFYFGRTEKSLIRV